MVSKSFRKSSIIGEARQVKGFVEKNRKIPLTCQFDDERILSCYSTTYLMSIVIQNNFKSNTYELIDVILYNTAKHKDTIQEKVTKQDYLQMINNFISYCKTNKRVPSYITTQKTRTKVSFELFLYCLAKIIVFYQENKYLPNYCTFNMAILSNNKSPTNSSKKSSSKSTSTSKKITNCTNPYTSSPHFLEKGCNKLGQCTPYYCGPHSIHQAIRKFGITKYSEKQIAAWCGTTTAGSDHNGINTAIAKISKESGVKLSVTWKNFSDLGGTVDERFEALAKLLCDPNIAVATHIGYANSGESKIIPNKSKVFGHYELLDKINLKTHYVRALNSLGVKRSDGSYQGHLQDRSFETQRTFFANTPGGQKALLIIKKG